MQGGESLDHPLREELLLILVLLGNFEDDQIHGVHREVVRRSNSAFRSEQSQSIIETPEAFRRKRTKCELDEFIREVQSRVHVQRHSRDIQNRVGKELV
jgi:hypothetical protein